MEVMSEVFPVDFDALEKGQVIPAEKVRDIYRPATEQEHNFKCMELVAEIERNRSDLFPVIRKGGIVILTDEEAHNYSIHRHAKLVGDMSRNARRRARIDHERLSEPQRREAEHWDAAMAAHAIDSKRQLRAARREALMLAGKTETPTE